MITKMKKLTFLVFYKDYEAFLERLHDLGVIHVQQREQGQISNPQLADDVRLLSRCNAALTALEPLVVQPKKPASGRRFCCQSGSRAAVGRPGFCCQPF